MKKIINIIILLLLVSVYAVSSGAKVRQYDINMSYAAGDIVINGGKYYECVEKFSTNQCNFGEGYEPGKGINWEMTWIEVDTPTQNILPTSSSNIQYVGSPEVPGNPIIGSIPTISGSGTYTLEWTIPQSATAGEYVKLEENGIIIENYKPENAGPIRFGSFKFENKANGNYSYAVYLCKQSGGEICTKGNTISLNVRNSYNGINKPSNSSNTPLITPIKNTQSTESVSKKYNIPTLKVLPRNNDIFNFDDKIEASVKKTITKHKLTKKQIRAVVNKLDSWLQILSTENLKGNLTGKEKRSYFVLKIIKESFNSHVN